MSDRPLMLYILAPSYSGSTLLTYLLAQHQDISTIGELKATRMGDIDSYRCSCGEMIRECEFWAGVAKRAAEEGIEFSLDKFGTVYESQNAPVNKVVRALVRGRIFEWVRAALLAILPDRLTRVREVNHNNFTISQIVCESQGGRIFLDGSKDSARLLHYLRSGLWDVRVIYLQRDGRGITNSYVKHDGADYVGAVAYWKKAIAELQNMRRRLPDDIVFDLLYEDLCRDPESKLAEICQWLGIAALDHDAGLMNSPQHILGNSMRLGNVTEIRFDEGWRKVLTEENLRTFEQQAGATNRILGYEQA